MAFCFDFLFNQLTKEHKRPVYAEAKEGEGQQAR